ncbi:MAG TPA: GntR family transcriptional regulator, partial [Actinoplanes sp.]|nr:GntR family transcriptional regulator [Actinoplanes sp.]
MRGAIVDGRLATGARLPATRLLARDLGVSRGVVVEAYQRLLDEGLVSGHTGIGTFVSFRAVRQSRLDDSASYGAVQRSRLDDSASYRAVRRSRPGGSVASRGRPPGPDGLRLPLPTPPGIDLDLSPGVPDLSAFPRTAWLRAERAVLGRAGGADLGYGDPGGTP